MTILLVLAGLTGIITFTVKGLIATFKKNGKAKKNFLLSAASFVLIIVAVATLPTTEKATETKAEPKQEQAAAVKEEPKAEPKKVEKTAVELYETELTKNKLAWIPVIKDFGEWTTKAGQDVSLLVDPDYKAEGHVITLKMAQLVGQAKAIEAPEEVAARHALWMKVMENYEFIATNLMTGIDSMDAALITESMEKMTIANRFIEEHNAMQQ